MDEMALVIGGILLITIGFITGVVIWLRNLFTFLQEPRHRPFMDD